MIDNICAGRYPDIDKDFEEEMAGMHPEQKKRLYKMLEGLDLNMK